MSAAMLRAAISQMRLKLLDLTGRNRLLNFKHSPGKSLQFVGGSIARVAAKIQEEGDRSNIAITPLPEPPLSAYVRRAGRLEPPDPVEWARRNQIPTSYEIEEDDEEDEEGAPRLVLQSLLYGEPLARHCRKLEREAVLAIEETGANTLFLVAGMLEFPDQNDSERTFTAPLVCIPVVFKSQARASHQSFSIQNTGEEITENLSLREKLRNDYDISLPDFDDDDFDLVAYLTAVELVIDQKPGFALHQTLSLCLLSFSSMLMVRDLDPEKWPASNTRNSLLDHPVVRQIFEGVPESAAGHGYSIAEEYAVEEAEGARIPLVYDADSSQHSALIDVLAKGRNLVIEGPPGTGKSQTITNLIAAALDSGKTVLFVAEKLAALQVVQSRLAIAGLDPFILELHSSKTNKKLVVEGLSQRLDLRPRPSDKIKASQEQLEAHRKALKEYADVINSVTQNRMDLTLHQVMWRAERHRAAMNEVPQFLSSLSILGTESLTSFEFAQRCTCLANIASQYALIGCFDTQSPFWGFFPKNLVQGDEVVIRELLRAGSAAARVLDEVTRTLVDDCKILIRSWPGHVAEYAKALGDFSRQLDRSLPLSALEGFYRARKLRVDPKTVLQDLDAAIRAYSELVASVEAVLKSSSPDQSLVDRLTALVTMGDQLGIELGTAEALPQLIGQLQSIVCDLKAGIDFLAGAGVQLSVDVKPHRFHLLAVLNLTTIIDAPIDAHLHLQTPQLARFGALKDLRELQALHDECFTLQKRLDKDLYIDALPAEGELQQAVRVLRRGNRWYRFLQKDWRGAVNLHRDLQKTKIKVSPAYRLNDLEDLLRWLEIKARMLADSRWGSVLGVSVPTRPFDFGPAIALADWNERIYTVASPFGSDPFRLAQVDGSRLQALREILRAGKPALEQAQAALDRVVQLSAGHLAVMPLDNLEVVVSRFGAACDQFGKALPVLRKRVWPHASVREAWVAARNLAVIAGLLEAIRSNAAARELLGAHFLGEATAVEPLLRAAEVLERLDGLTVDVGVRTYIESGPFVERVDQIASSLVAMVSGLASVKVVEAKLQQMGTFDMEQWAGIGLQDDLRGFAQGWRRRVDQAGAAAEALIPWSLYVDRREEGFARLVGDFVLALEARKVPAKDLSDGYAYGVYAGISRAAFQAIPCLGRFSGLMHSQIRAEFQRLDREIISLRGQAIAAQLCATTRAPDGESGVRVGDKTEMSLIYHLLPQQRPRVPLRRLMSRAPKSMQALKPCFMMGPQAVAQYLAPGDIQFDLVIMDEASQLRPEEAIGTVARGGQLVVVGDPKQLPPTSFFARTADPADETQYTTTDAESILDICAAQFQPMRTLRWHYRSQHQSLIAFSNKNFYDGKLVIFPSPYGQGGALGVRAIYLADAIYENQSNLREAKRVVDAVAEHIRLRPKESLGVVTLNISQRDLISELLEQRIDSIVGGDVFRERWKSENQGLFVKNLENVQGDERDTIIISTTFGRAPGTTVVRQGFGPISRDGGWRRLNVLFTRARRSVLLVTSMRPEDIVVGATTPAGTRALKGYLEYARSGALVAAEESAAQPDSEFEVAVMNVLAKAGYEVTPQLGVAGYRIDIGVKHPRVPGAYLAAIECDGATYHSAASSRDRDRIRQEILESLGWKGRIWRIWSTDWFRSPASEIAKLQEFLAVLRDTWRPEHAAGESWAEEGSAAVAAPAGAVQRVVASRPAAATVQAAEREEVRRALIGSEELLEVGIGDTVTYIDLSEPGRPLGIRIIRGATDVVRGVVNENAPIALEMLGAAVGDEIDVVNKRYRVLKIARPT